MFDLDCRKIEKLKRAPKKFTTKIKDTYLYLAVKHTSSNVEDCLLICILLIKVSTNRTVQGRCRHHQWQYQSNQLHQYELQMSTEVKTIMVML